jgi:SAM-dependent methyltransferase
VKRKDLELHKKLGVTVIDPDIGINYGGQNIFSAVMWQLDHLTNLCYNKLKHQRSESPEPKIDKKLNKANWQSYALPFSAVQTGVQSELQKESNKYFYGRVGDFGCGSGRMGTLAQHNNNVSHYLGIDACPEMVSIAKQAFKRYDYDKCQVIHRYIEHTNDFQFDVGVSLNSLYSWENPARVLKHIYTLLKPGGLLILADPSPNISIDILEKEEEKHQIFNNYYDEFKRFNIEFIHRYEYRFLTMDKLIELTRSCGFNVKECHQRFYHGGMNFIVLEKPQ